MRRCTHQGKGSARQTWRSIDSVLPSLDSLVVPPAPGQRQAQVAQQRAPGVEAGWRLL